MKRQHRCCRRNGLACAVAMALGTVCTGGWASVGAQSAGALHIAEVSDAELAGMRGKYVAGGSVVYFGVEMQTQWATADGSFYTGALSFDVDRSTSFQPTVTVMTGAEAQVADAYDAASATAGGGSISSGGLNDTSGVGQVVQVTGDGNSVINVVTLDVTGKSGGPTTLSSSLGTGSTTAVAPNGGVVTITVDSGQLGVTISVPGQGSVSQTVSNMTGVHQQAQVFGDLNTITNTMQITAQVQAVQQAMGGSMRMALDNLRGVSGLGMF